MCYNNCTHGASSSWTTNNLMKNLYYLLKQLGGGVGPFGRTPNLKKVHIWDIICGLCITMLEINFRGPWLQIFSGEVFASTPDKVPPSASLYVDCRILRKKIPGARWPRYAFCKILYPPHRTWRCSVCMGKPSPRCKETKEIFLSWFETLLTCIANEMIHLILHFRYGFFPLTFDKCCYIKARLHGPNQEPWYVRVL